MYFPLNWEFGSALSKLRNFRVGVWTPPNPLGTPLNRWIHNICYHNNLLATLIRMPISPKSRPLCTKDILEVRYLIIKREGIKKLNQHHSLQWISATSTIFPSILMYVSHVFTNFKYSVALVTGHLYSLSLTNSHFHLLTTVLTSPLYPLPVNFHGQKHISPINTGPNNELICRTKFPLPFPTHINVLQEEELFNRR
jgi:hypothetical protein